LQNYPNPFSARGTTRIRFDLPQAAEIEVNVFDLTGREVLELANGYRRAGNHEVIWNGRNRAGAEMSTGIYFVRLRYRAEPSGVWSQLLRRAVMMKQ
jgi:hypothetical protein